MIRSAALLVIASGVAAAQLLPPRTPANPPAKAPSRTAAAAAKPAPSGAIPTYNELKYPELRPIAVPPVESITLPSGIRVFLSENHELPLVNGTVLVRTGTVFDPPEKVGLANVAGQALLDASTNRPDEDLLRKFSDMGTDVMGYVSENVLSISFSSLKENIDATLDMLKDALTAPAFPQDRLDLAKIQMRNNIAHRNDDPGAVLQREFNIAVYGKNSPYTSQLEYATVDRINRADVVAFYQRYFSPKNVMISLEGDFDSAKMKSRIAALFDEWKSDQPVAPEFPKVGDSGGTGKYLATRKDMPRALFEVGQLGGDYTDKDYPALEIMADILGGGSQSRLHLRLQGGVEGLSAAWSPGFGHPGVFRVSGAVVNPFFTTQILRVVMDEVNKIRAGEVSEQELNTAKNAALNSMVFAFDNQLTILPRLTQYAYFGLPTDFTQQHQKGLEAVTRADVLRVARERLDPAKMVTLVVGNPTAFETPLDSLGGSRVYPLDLTIPPPKPEAELGDPVTQRRGKQLLARAQQAMGGADKLAAVSDYVAEISYQFDPSAGGVQANMTERWISSGHLRQDNSMPDGKVSVYSDGKTGWVANTNDSAALAGVQLDQMKSDLFRILFSLLLSDRAPNRKVNALDDTTVEISDNSGQIAKVVFDPATGLIKNTLYDAPTANGPTPVIDTYSDFRDVNGVKVPFKTVITLSGKRFQELTIKSLQINSGVKVEDLQKRP